MITDLMKFSNQHPCVRISGEKGNLRFPLDQAIPYRLIETIVKLRVKQNLAKAGSVSRE